MAQAHSPIDVRGMFQRAASAHKSGGDSETLQPQAASAFSNVQSSASTFGAPSFQSPGSLFLLPSLYAIMWALHRTSAPNNIVVNIQVHCDNLQVMKAASRHRSRAQLPAVQGRLPSLALECQVFQPVLRDLRACQPCLLACPSLPRLLVLVMCPGIIPVP